MIRRKSAGHAAVILVAATLLGGCQASAESPSATTATSNGSSPAAASTGVEPSPQASAEAASDSVGPSAAASAAASDSVGPSPAASAAAATLTIKKISTKRWGDAPFKATAAASDGAPVRFGGSGGCTVDPLSGRVTIKAVGTCTVTATAKAGDKTLGASATFTIEPAQPVIKFGARETRFKSNLHFALNAISVPGIKLGYRRHPGRDRNIERRVLRRDVRRLPCVDEEADGGRPRCHGCQVHGSRGRCSKVR